MTLILIFLVGWNVWWVAAGDIIRRSPLCPWLLPFLLERRFLKTDEQLILISGSWYYHHYFCAHVYSAHYLNKQLHHYPFTDWTLFCVYNIRALHCASYSWLRHWQPSPPGLTSAAEQCPGLPSPSSGPSAWQAADQSAHCAPLRNTAGVCERSQRWAGILKLEWQNTSSSHQLRARTSICTVSHKSEVTPHSFINILSFHGITLKKWHVNTKQSVYSLYNSVNLLSPQNNSTHSH